MWAVRETQQDADRGGSQKSFSSGLRAIFLRSEESSQSNSGPPPAPRPSGSDGSRTRWRRAGASRTWGKTRGRKPAPANKSARWMTTRAWQSARELGAAADPEDNRSIRWESRALLLGVHVDAGHRQVTGVDRERYARDV